MEEMLDEKIKRKANRITEPTIKVERENAFNGNKLLINSIKNKTALLNTKKANVNNLVTNNSNKIK
jgi:hypothetical protein